MSLLSPKTLRIICIFVQCEQFLFLRTTSLLTIQYRPSLMSTHLSPEIKARLICSGRRNRNPDVTRGSGSLQSYPESRPRLPRIWPSLQASCGRFSRFFPLHILLLASGLAAALESHAKETEVADEHEETRCGWSAVPRAPHYSAVENRLLPPNQVGSYVTVSYLLKAA